MVTYWKSGYASVVIAIFLLTLPLRAQIQLQRISIIGNRNNAPYWSNSAIIADDGDNLRLSYLLEVRPAQLYSTVYISPCRNIIFDGDTLEQNSVYAPDDLLTEATSIVWCRVEPAKLDTVYKNHLGLVTPFAVIHYRESGIAEWQDKEEIRLNSTTFARQVFPGTVWLKIELRHGTDFVGSAGAERRCLTDQGDDFGGLSEAVFRVSCRGRTGSKLLDNVLLYRNIPFIVNPVSFDRDWSNHQTSRWIGGNLNTFIVAAALRLDVFLLDYIEKLPLPEYNYFTVTEYVHRGLVRQSDFYMSTDDWKEIALDNHLFHQGDIIISRSKAALFYQDRSAPDSEYAGEANQRLDRFDLVLECNDGSLRWGTLQETLGDTISLIRWKRRWLRY